MSRCWQSYILLNGVICILGWINIRKLNKVDKSHRIFFFRNVSYFIDDKTEAQKMKCFKIMQLMTAVSETLVPWHTVDLPSILLSSQILKLQKNFEAVQN